MHYEKKHRLSEPFPCRLTETQRAELTMIANELSMPLAALIRVAVHDYLNVRRQILAGQAAEKSA